MSRFSKKTGGASSASSASSENQLVFIKPADLARAGFTGVVAEGEFVSTQPNNFNPDKDDFKIVADTAFKIKGQDKNEDFYEKDIAAGDTLIINGAGNLNFHMKKVSLGEVCQIVYNGKIDIESGKFAGKQAHNFEVAYGAEEE